MGAASFTVGPWNQHYDIATHEYSKRGQGLALFQGLDMEFKGKV